MNDASDLYLRVREREGRLYPDDIARRLPAVPEDHPLRAEWQARAASCARLLAYLARLQQRITMLELGCGNGWLANRFAGATNASIVGLDINHSELCQAHRLFGACPDLSWIAANIFCAPFGGRSFDIIVIASAIQYFADLPRLFEALIELLRQGGEIHILDSPFYSVGELPAARERTRKYYEGLGFPEMAALYHHHSTAALDRHNPDWLYVPKQQGNRDTATTDSPFPWIRLRPEI